MAIQLYKAYIRSRLEYGCVIWGYHQKIHLNKSESAQRRALLLILRTMKSTLTNTIEAELSVTPIDLCLEELQRHEAIKMHRDQDSYFNYKMNKTTKSTSKQSPCKHLQSKLKQLMKELAHQNNCTDLEKLQLPPVNPPTFEIFSIVQTNPF